MSSWANIVGSKPNLEPNQKVYWNTVKSCRISINFDNADYLFFKKTADVPVEGNEILKEITDRINFQTRAGQNNFLIMALGSKFLIKILRHDHNITVVDQQCTYTQNTGHIIKLVPVKHRLVIIHWE